MREVQSDEVAAVSGGVPERPQPDALVLQGPQPEPGQDGFAQMLALSRALRAQLQFA